ncbi:hypothetical protein N431DRAFT_546908 [Stipitochalara longipes BDJ]|nr:hypothetical protein N431DRAFT_546908 [Stipitochalara longipes BDJ]
MYRRNQLLGLGSAFGAYGLNNRGGNLLNRQHLFEPLGYCSGSTCESNPLTGEHICACYEGLRYLEMGQYLLEDCDCPDCPLLEMSTYGGRLLGAGHGRGFGSGFRGGFAGGQYSWGYPFGRGGLRPHRLIDGCGMGGWGR